MSLVEAHSIYKGEMQQSKQKNNATILNRLYNKMLLDNMINPYGDEILTLRFARK